MKLSPHFNTDTDRKIACQCGCGLGKKLSDVSPALIYALEAVREHFGAPVTINSLCRCKTHNKAVGGKSGSRHLQNAENSWSDAADITVAGVPPADVADYCEKLVRDRGGVGRYSSFTHVDTRGKKARWNG